MQFLHFWFSNEATNKLLCEVLTVQKAYLTGAPIDEQVVQSTVHGCVTGRLPHWGSVVPMDKQGLKRGKMKLSFL